MSYIINGMIWVMDQIFKLTGSWGLAVIGLTLLTRLVVLPATIMQARSLRKLALIQPEQAKLQKKYKDDPERLNLEIMELYRRHKVNPATSCLGFAIQLPVLLAVIRSLDAHPALKDATFLNLTLGKPGNWVLVALVVGSTYLATRFSPTMGTTQQQGSSQTAMTVVMLAIMGYFSMRYASAVSVYIITANVAGLLERFLVPRDDTTTLEGARSK